MSVFLSPIGSDAPYVDSSGNPLVGGTLSTFLAGSSTPATTYTTSAGSVANDLVMSLNSGGYPTTSSVITQIWLTGGVTYKFVLKNASGTTLWTKDNISGIGDTTLTVSEWQASGFTPTFVSATSFTVAGDQTSSFTGGRRLKSTNSGGTIYSTVSTSVFGALTTVTVVNDSGVLDSGLSAVSVSILQADHSSVPHTKSDSSGLTFQDAVDMAGKVSITGDISPSQITSNQNDYSPTGLSTAAVLRLTSDASRNITSIAGGSDGRILTLHNVGSFNIVLTKDDGATGTAGNRILLTSDTPIAPLQSVTLQYDSTSSRWRRTNWASKQPTRQVLTSGTAATYTTPTGATRLNVRGVGGSSGGGGANISSAATASTFVGTGVSLSAGGGAASVAAGGTPATAAAASGGDINVAGATGSVAVNSAVTNSGQAGASSVFGGAGGAGTGAPGTAGGAAAANSGSGGGGGGSTTNPCGSGGNAGAYVEKLIIAPAATFTYTVGAKSVGGTAGGNTAAGGDGAAGQWIVDEYYD